MQGPHFLRWQTLPGCSPDADRWRLCELLSFREAEELLDLLECCGIEEREVILVEGRLTVRWRQPAGV
jgi:hypothetical protein